MLPAHNRHTTHTVVLGPIANRSRPNESNYTEGVRPNYEKHVNLRPYSLMGLMFFVNERLA
jgi:hypothetical protein